MIQNIMIQNEEKRLTLMVTGNEIQRKKNVKLDYQKCHLSKQNCSGLLISNFPLISYSYLNRPYLVEVLKSSCPLPSRLLALGQSVANYFAF